MATSPSPDELSFDPYQGEAFRTGRASPSLRPDFLGGEVWESKRPESQQSTAIPSAPWRPLSAVSAHSGDSGHSPRRVRGSRPGSATSRTSRSSFGGGRRGTTTSFSEMDAASRRYAKAMDRPLSAIAARKVMAQKPPPRTINYYTDPKILAPAVVRPASASMHESSLLRRGRFSPPSCERVQLTARNLRADMAKQETPSPCYTPRMPSSPNHQRFCLPPQLEDPAKPEDPESPRSAEGPQSPRSARFLLGSAFSTRTLRALFKSIDVDNSGSIKPSELLWALRDRPKLLRMFNIIRAHVKPEDAHPWLLQGLMEGSPIGKPVGMPGMDHDKLRRDEMYWMREMLKDNDDNRTGQMEWPEFLRLFQRAGLHYRAKTREDLNQTSDGEDTCEDKEKTAPPTRDARGEAKADPLKGSEGVLSFSRRASAQQWRERMAAPQVDAVTVSDPRAAGRHPLQRRFDGDGLVSVVAFQGPADANDAQRQPWDALCGAGCLGSAWDVSPELFQLEVPIAPGMSATFSSAAAAFQATRFWRHASELSALPGAEAQRRAAELGRPDPYNAGLGGAWGGMLEILRRKFKPDSVCGRALVQTADAFLLHHVDEAGADPMFSDGGDGRGRNWLGLQLMLVRDRLRQTTRWTNFINKLVNVRTGDPWNTATAQQWQDAVRGAQAALSEALTAAAGHG